MTGKLRKKNSGGKSFADLIAKYGLDVGSISNIQSSDSYKALPKEMLSFFVPAKSPYEQRWRLVGVEKVEDVLGSTVVFSAYEWLSFKVPGGSYTPDFFYVLADGRVVLVEIKPSKFADNYRDSRSKLRAAATLNPFFVFAEARFEEKRWVMEIVFGDSEFLAALQDFTAIVKEKGIDNE